MLTYSTVSGALGPLTLYFEDEALIGLNFGPFSEGASLRTHLARYFPGQEFVHRESPALPAVRAWLDGYAKGQPQAFSFAVRLFGTDFQCAVWRQLLSIPFGTTVSYSQLARRLSTRAVRAVGSAVGRNPIPILIPCHRVIRQDGSLGQYSAGAGPATKRQLLELEQAALHP